MAVKSMVINDDGILISASVDKNIIVWNQNLDVQYTIIIVTSIYS
jgi:hypothetical protein